MSIELMQLKSGKGSTLASVRELWTPQMVRDWVAENPDDVALADALAAVWNFTGELGHLLDEGECDEGDFVAWQKVERELAEAVMARLNVTDAAGGICKRIEPFMNENGYRDGGGWWHRAREE